MQQTYPRVDRLLVIHSGFEQIESFRVGFFLVMPLMFRAFSRCEEEVDSGREMLAR